VESAAVVYELRPLDPALCPPGTAAPALPKPFMRTPPGLSAASLARYVASKLPLSADVAAAAREVVITAAGQAVHPDALLSTVLLSALPEPGAAVPAVRYRFAAPQA
jgi:hypothetical protein